MHRAETQSRGELSENQLGSEIIAASIEVHRELGPGLLESVYEGALAYELELRGLEVNRQLAIPVRYKGQTFDHGFRADLIIQSKVLIELKSVSEISAVHRKQIQTYLRLTGLKLGYLLNFGSALMKNGIVRAVNGLEEETIY